MVILSAATSAGGRRPPNQDSFFIERGQSMYSADELFLCGENRETALAAVFDGIGGGLCGDVASRAAAKELDGFLQNGGLEGDTLGDVLLNAVAYVEDAVGLKLEELMSEGRVTDPRREGCTMSAAAVAPDGRYAALNVGDSPIFLVSGGHASELSERHTVANRKRAAGCSSDEITERDGHVITCAINPIFHPFENAYLFGDFFLEDGSAIVITSDGVSENLGEGELAAVVSPLGASEEELTAFELSAAARLVKAAKKNFRKNNSAGLFGAKAKAVRAQLDNCTAVVMYFHAERESKEVENNEQ